MRDAGNLTYKKLHAAEVEQWNLKLQNTSASFFQYPYYGSGNEELPHSSVVYYEFFDESRLIAFASCLCVRVWFIKIGLIIRGPVVLDSNTSASVLEILKKIQKQENYFFLRINPNIFDIELVEELKTVRKVLSLDPFPIYKGSQDRDFIIRRVDSEEELLKHYKPRARQNIRYGKEENFEFIKTADEREAHDAYDILIKVSESKNFKFRPLNSYLNILKNGSKYNLCHLYLAKEDGKIVNVAFIVKDGNGYTYLSGGLISGRYKPRNSPSSLLHHQIIKECLIDEKRSNYNITYTGPEQPLFTFKSSFNPEELHYPPYYTITNHKWFVRIFLVLQQKFLPRIKKMTRMKYGNRK